MNFTGALSEIELESLQTRQNRVGLTRNTTYLPLPAHDSAAGASAAHRCESWLDGDNGTADDLSNAVTADATDTLRAGECIFE